MSLDTTSNVGTLNAMWLDTSQYVSLAELMQLSGFSEQDIREFVEVGVLTPAVPSAAEPQFSATYVMSVRKAGQLKTELDLDLNALVVVLTLLEQIRGMECDMSKLRARLPEYRCS